MRIWSLIFGAGALVSICVGGGVAVGILFGQRIAERDFCEDRASGHFIADDAARGAACD